MDVFNHYMLTLAREARGLTQAELAASVSVGQGTLSKYETGFLQPPPDFVSVLASALGYPSSFFYQEGRAFGFPPFHYRKRKKLSAKALGKIVAEMNIRRMHLQKLLISYELRPSNTIPEIDPDEYQGSTRRRLDAEDVARAVREAWLLPRGPIPNMVDLIEQAGGIVMHCDFSSDLIDAMSQRIDGLPILFFVNSNAPMDRVRFTLAHELAHMILHTITLKDDQEMESEADIFAQAFLLPADEFKTQMRKFDLRHLANLKSYWKVSMQALAYRAESLKLITPYQSKMFWIEMSKLGYRKREPNEPPKETPSLVRRMIEFHRKALGYSTQDLASLLCLSVQEFEQMYAPAALGGEERPKGHLRVVK